jgi:alpha-D-xyloside xylohydrolase
MAWQATRSPFLLTFSLDGRRLTGESGSGQQRLSFSTGGSALHSLTSELAARSVPGGERYTVSTDEPGREGVVTVTRLSAGVQVEFRLLPSTGVKAVYESLAAAPTEHFLGGGEQSNFIDLRGHSVSLLVGYACGVEFPMPFFLSSAGYGVFVRSNKSGLMAFPGSGPVRPCLRGPNPDCRLTPHRDLTELCIDDDELVYRLYDGSPRRVLSAFAADAGRPAPAALAQFGAQKWRGVWAENTAQDVLGDVLRYRRLGIPLSWIHINDPWEQGGCWGSLLYDTSRFPNPAALVHRIHALGIRVMLWVSPLVSRSTGCNVGYTPRDLLGPSTSAAELDLTTPSALRVFERRLRRALSIGIDGIKGDRGDEIDLTGSRLHDRPGSELQNLYPELFARAVTQVLRSLRQGFSTIFRAGSLGSQHLLPGIDLGDLPGTFAGLQTAIRRGLSVGVSGYPVWGSDIGGYSNATPPLTAELFVRWAQFGAVSPILEVGGLGESRDFWRYGPAIVDVFRAASVLHYELAPYFLELSRRADTTGVPIVRPLGLDYPTDPSAWGNPLEFTIGTALLAAPVAGPAGGLPGNTLARPTIYLPPGDWVDLNSGYVLPGGSTFVRPTPLSELPLYLRAGTAIPFNVRKPTIWQQPWGLNELEHAGRAAWLYAIGSGYAHANAPGYGTLTAHTNTAGVSITLAHAAPQNQVLVLTRGFRGTVVINGRPLPESKPTQLRSAPDGWTRRPAPFGGILLKLTTQTGRAAATLRPG